MFSRKDLENGDIVTYRNKEKRTILGGALYSESGYIRGLYNIAEDLIDIDGNNEYDIVKVERPVEYKTVYERKELLDEVETRYLRNVIRPFRNKVNFIKKVSYDDKAYITIDVDSECIDFPYFEKDTMYNGMKINKEYTLEELGL